MIDLAHGSASTYINRGCRCDECAAAHRAKTYDYLATHPESLEQQREARRSIKRARQYEERFGEYVDWQIIRELRAQPCVGCGLSPAKGVDHIIPRERDGQNVIENLQPMCPPCNKRKGRR